MAAYQTRFRSSDAKPTVSEKDGYGFLKPLTTPRLTTWCGFEAASSGMLVRPGTLETVMDEARDVEDERACCGEASAVDESMGAAPRRIRVLDTAVGIRFCQIRTVCRRNEGDMCRVKRTKQ